MLYLPNQIYPKNSFTKSSTTKPRRSSLSEDNLKGSTFENIPILELSKSKSNRRNSENPFEQIVFKSILQRTSTMKDNTELAKKQGIIKAHFSILREKKKRFSYSKWKLNFRELHYINDIFQALIGFTSCILYILMSFNPYEDEDSSVWESKIANIASYTEFTITTISTVDLCRNVIFTTPKLSFFKSGFNWVDMFTVLPAYLTYLVPARNNLSFLHILQIIRLIRVLKIFRALKSDEEVRSHSRISAYIQRQLLIIAIQAFSFIFILSGVMFELNIMFGGIFEYQYPTNCQIETSNYYCIDLFNILFLFYEIMTTTAFGDILPVSRISMGIVCIMIVLSVIMRTSVFYRIKFLISQRKEEIPKQILQNHIIIIGDVSNRVFNSINTLLSSLQRNPETEIILIYIGEKMTLVDSVYPLNLQIKYIQTDNIERKIMKEICISEASHVMIINDLSSKLPSKALQKLKNFNLKRKPVFIDFTLSRPIFSYLFLSSNHILNLSLLKGRFMLISVKHNGILSFLMNVMLMSGNDSMNFRSKESLPLEYLYSSNQEMFTLQFPTILIGSNAHVIRNLLYEIHNILLLGTQNAKGTFFLQSTETMISEGDFAIIFGHKKEAIKAFSSINTSSILEFQNPLYGTSNRRKKKMLNLDLIKNSEKNSTLTLDFRIKNKILNSNEKFGNEIENHICVFCLESEVEEIVLGLRKFTKRIICFIFRKVPEELAKRFCDGYTSVVFFEGDCLRILDLRAAGVEKAFHVIVYSLDYRDELIPETYLLINILTLKFKVPLTIEMESPRDCIYLPQFLKGEKNIRINEKAKFNLNFSMGQVFYRSIVYDLALKSNNQPFIYGFLEYLFPNEINGKLEEDKVFCTHIPSEYYGKPFREFNINLMFTFPQLLAIGIIKYKLNTSSKAISINPGLQRLGTKSFDNTKNGNKRFLNSFENNSIIYLSKEALNCKRKGFVFCNPLSSTPIREGDEVILIGEIEKYRKERVKNIHSKYLNRLNVISENPQECMDQGSSTLLNYNLQKSLLTNSSLLISNLNKNWERIYMGEQLISSLKESTKALELKAKVFKNDHKQEISESPQFQILKTME